MFSQMAGRWFLLGTMVFFMIMIPFVLFEAQFETWTNNLTESPGRSSLAALALGSLLAGDILLPTPSSMVSTAAGFTLGFVRGMLVSFVGMTASCLLGFWLGAKFGRPLANRLVGEDELRRLENASQRFGDWVIVVSRPVPMFAEASVLFAGASRMAISRFLFFSTLSNLGISVVYAAVGAFSATANSFLLAFGASVLLPAFAMFLSRKTKVLGGSL